MIRPGTVLKPLRVMTNRLTMPAAVGVKYIRALVDAPAAESSRLTWTQRNVSAMATRDPLRDASRGEENEKKPLGYTRLMLPPAGTGEELTNEKVDVHLRPATRSATSMLNVTSRTWPPIAPDGAPVALAVSRDVAMLMALEILAVGAVPRCSPVRVTKTVPAQGVKRVLRLNAMAVHAAACLRESAMPPSLLELGRSAYYQWLCRHSGSWRMKQWSRLPQRSCEPLANTSQRHKKERWGTLMPDARPEEQRTGRRGTPKEWPIFCGTTRRMLAALRLPRTERLEL